MPSPLGHALAGAAAGWAVAPALRAMDPASRLWREGVLFACLAVAPDLDLLTSAHRGPTHSLTAACLAGVLVWGFTRNTRLALAAAAAYATHVFLDWLGADSSPPLGLTALWPFDHRYYESGLHFFPAVTRRFHIDGFWVQNIRAGLFEIVVLLPPFLIAVAVRWVRRQPLVRHRQEQGGNRS